MVCSLNYSKKSQHKKVEKIRMTNRTNNINKAIQNINP